MFLRTKIATFLCFFTSLSTLALQPTGMAKHKFLKSFSTDGCSSFPDGTFHAPHLWRDCCVIHDLKYWLGGSHDDRLDADADLAVCVNEKIQHENTDLSSLGFLMAIGVRVGGTEHLPTPWKWGYGYETRSAKIGSVQPMREQVGERMRELETLLSEGKGAKAYGLSDQGVSEFLEQLRILQKSLARNWLSLPSEKN